MGFLASSRLDSHAIRRSEDAHVDRLIAGVPALGAPTVQALFPRAWIDVNREPSELDPSMFDGPLARPVRRDSARVRAGLGIIPRVVSGGMEIYAGSLPAREAERRIATAYVPYHDTLASLLDATLGLFGSACLIDCHSMPSSCRGGGGRTPDVVLGDRFGSSCAPGVSLATAGALESLGAVVHRNDPYPGGHITRRYGRPGQGVHALQIEINRGLYLDEASLETTAGLESAARLVEAAVLAVSGALEGEAAAVEAASGR